MDARPEDASETAVAAGTNCPVLQCANVMQTLVTIPAATQLPLTMIVMRRSILMMKWNHKLN